VDDPPVLWALDEEGPGDEWRECAPTFSTWVYTHLWDGGVLHTLPHRKLFGPASPGDLGALRERFIERPATMDIRRFAGAEDRQRIRVLDVADGSGRCQFEVAAATPELFDDVVAAVQPLLG
jgi:hypothetical protein